MIVVSHRGPARFEANDDGTFDTKLGAGGLSVALAPLLVDRPDVTWVAAALSDGDRAAAAAGAAHVGAVDLRLLSLDVDVHRRHLDTVSTGTLWFLYHGMFDLVSRPRFDPEWFEAWESFVAVNRSFADAVLDGAQRDDIVLVQDYQLSLVPGMVVADRPDLRVAHFTHTPFCGPNSIRMLPDAVATELVEGMAHVPCGFHTERWARAFAASAREVAPDVGTRTFVAPLGPDLDALRRDLDSDRAAEAGAELEEIVGDRKLLLRTDRIEPTKNIVRGFDAYDLLLERSPELRERVVFVAMVHPSRETMPEYQAYGDEVGATADRVNERWATSGWTPIVVDRRDDFARALAGYRRYDVLLVNPIKDGLNLVAKEGPLCNERDGVLCLSPEAGSWDELGGAALPAHPFDLVATADALAQALAMPADERASRAAALREAAGASTPADWLDDQLAALD